MKALEHAGRSVFSSFCDAIESPADKLSGGPPQLVGLYRKGLARPFGIIHKGKRYFNGLPVPDSANLGAVEWRNCSFEICGNTMQRRAGAQRQPRPSGLPR